MQMNMCAYLVRNIEKGMSLQAKWLRRSLTDATPHIALQEVTRTKKILLQLYL